MQHSDKKTTGLSLKMENSAKTKVIRESCYKSRFENAPLSCNFGMAPCRAAKFTENKNYQWNHGGFATTSTRLPLKMQNSQKTKTINGIMLQISL